jgi:hypothetical protein
MPGYHLTWEIDIDDATDARHAAQQALRIQRDSTSVAIVFGVIEYDGANAVRIDLTQTADICECGRKPWDCATYDGKEEHGDR